MNFKELGDLIRCLGTDLKDAALNIESNEDAEGKTVINQVLNRLFELRIAGDI